MTNPFQNAKVFVAGHRGLIGSALMSALEARGCRDILTRSRETLDLLNKTAVRDFLVQEKPDLVLLAAAKVGGILANNSLRADFIFENLEIQNNVIWESFRAGVPKLVFLGSSCIYPRGCPQPMKEEHLLTSSLEETNRPYAIAKIAGLELVASLRRQYGVDYFSVMPTNLYGPNDNFHPENSHVLPALLRRFHEAKKARAESVTIWGSGEPRREFLFSADCAEAILSLVLQAGKNPMRSWLEGGLNHFNVGTGVDVTIRELAETIARVVGFEGRLTFDASKPNGTLRKLLSIDRIAELGWQPKVSLAEGIAQTYAWYVSHPEQVRL
jgi:GDP-L-fucose synthase